LFYIIGIYVDNIYLVKCTRPNISFSVHIADCEKPTDWKKVIIIFKYLNNSINYKLLYDGIEKNTYIHRYRFHPREKEDGKFTSGHIILKGNLSICWNSKKHYTIATFTAEAEYISTDKCSKKVLWIRNILIELFNDKSLIILYSDNMASKICIENGEINTKLKHISIKYYFSKNNIIDKRIKLKYKNNNEMLDDALPKNIN